MRMHVAGLLMAGLLGLAMPVAAEFARFELAGPPQPAFAGQAFGDTGRYERLTARATISLDPADGRNAIIADLSAAPRNAQGRVEAVAEVVILRPAEPVRGNGTLLVEAPNRGRELAGQLYNDGPARPPHDQQPRLPGHHGIMRAERPRAAPTGGGACRPGRLDERRLR